MNCGRRVGYGKPADLRKVGKTNRGASTIAGRLRERGRKPGPQETIRMATAAPNQNLPLFYNSLEPLNATQHGTMKVRTLLRMPQIARDSCRSGHRRRIHACPAPLSDRVFGRRQFDSDRADGPQRRCQRLSRRRWTSARPNFYIPAFIRRYPFLLARLRPDSDELSLCFDPTANAVGEFDEGQPLFDGDQPSEATKAILQFCEQFEAAGQRTAAFVEESVKADLLMDGEVAIQPEGFQQPFVYRGFRMVDEEKLRNLRGDELRS